MSTATIEKPTTPQPKAKPEPETASPKLLGMKTCPRCRQNIAVFADGDGSDAELSSRYGQAWVRESDSVCKTCQMNDRAEESMAELRRQTERASFNQALMFNRERVAKQWREAGIWDSLDELTKLVVHRLLESAPGKGAEPRSLAVRKWAATCRKVVELFDDFDAWQVESGN